MRLAVGQSKKKTNTMGNKMDLCGTSCKHGLRVDLKDESEILYKRWDEKSNNCAKKGPRL